MYLQTSGWLKQRNFRYSCCNQRELTSDLLEKSTAQKMELDHILQASMWQHFGFELDVKQNEDKHRSQAHVNKYSKNHIMSDTKHYQS